MLSVVGYWSLGLFWDKAMNILGWTIMMPLRRVCFSNTGLVACVLEMGACGL